MDIHALAIHARASQFTRSTDDLTTSATPDAVLVRAGTKVIVRTVQPSATGELYGKAYTFGTSDGGDKNRSRVRASLCVFVCVCVGTQAFCCALCRHEASPTPERWTAL